MSCSVYEGCILDQRYSIAVKQKVETKNNITAVKLNVQPIRKYKVGLMFLCLSAGLRPDVQNNSPDLHNVKTMNACSLSSVTIGMKHNELRYIHMSGISNFKV